MSNPATKKRVTVYFSGHVQRVGFRYSTQQIAAGFELNGTIRNLDDGRVELLAEGIADELNAFLQAIAESHLAAHVRQKEITWDEPRGDLHGYKIVR